MSSNPDKISNSAVAAYLQFLRKGRGLSQQDLAARINSEGAEIEAFERAQGQIDEETLEKAVIALQAARHHIAYLLAQQPAGRDESARLIRTGIDLARGWLQGEDLLEKQRRALDGATGEQQ